MTTSTAPVPSTDQKLPQISKPTASKTRKQSSATRNYKIGNVIVTTVLSIGAIIMIAPLLWMLSTSVKTKDAVFALPPEWIPEVFVWDNYVRIWFSGSPTGNWWDGAMATGITNSLIVACTVTIIGTFFSALAAFAFAKLRVPGREKFFLLLLTGLMIPYPAIMLPQFSMFSSLGWVNTLLPLIIPGLFGNIMMIFFLKQYLTSVPDSMIEAAKIDGAGYFRTFVTMIFPMIKPAVAAQFILWFMAIWNDYLAPTIYLSSPEKQTLQVVIASMKTQYAIQTDYPLIMTASVIALIPVLLIFAVFQKQIIESIALTGSKG